MERVTFTGTRHLREQDKAVIKRVVAGLPGDSMLIVGGCVGVDAYIARVGIGLAMYVHVVLPDNMSQVDPEWWKYFTYYEKAPGGSTYRDRNQRMLVLGDRLIAFAEHPEDHPASRRSGTWMTIRMARKCIGYPVEVYVLSASSVAPS